MENIPQEFDPDVIAGQSGSDLQMYHAETSSKEPMSSVLKNNPEIYFVTPRGVKIGVIGTSVQVPITTQPRAPSMLIGASMTCQSRAKIFSGCVRICCAGVIAWLKMVYPRIR